MTAPAPTQPTLADGRYALDEVLGRGSLAVTHRAHDRRLGRWVAVKSLVPDPVPEVAAAQRARFLREARALARFDHPGIVRVYEVFEEGGTAHLVMEHLHGRSVGAELVARGGPLPADELAALATGAGRALAAVHAAGLLHRDVSPSNVVLVDGDGGRRPVLIDFGLARDVADATDTLTRMVTPGFAPPEQYGGDPSRVGPATDVYGLAATLYHSAAGRLPASAVDRQHGARLEPLRRLRPDLPRPFCDGVHDGLELDPAHRPPDVATLLARLGLGEEQRPMAPTAPAPGPAALLGASVAPSAAVPPKNGSRSWAAVVPLLLLVVAAGIAAPLAGPAALGAVALPLVATIGDRLRGRRRVALPWRFVLNTVRSATSSWPGMLVAAGGAAVSLLIDRADPVTTADDAVAAVAGAAAALFVALRVGGDRDRLAAADAVDAWAARVRPSDGALYAAWAAGLLALAGALVLRPDLWPIVSS